MTTQTAAEPLTPVAPTYIAMKSDPRFSEAWLEQVISDDPSLLDLGDLELVDTQVAMPGGGRLDMLLRDPESLTRYEVELQLGSLDESHIVRAIEYWDIERRRYPHYEHIAVIAAESVSQRFHNVIQLIGESVPLIAIELRLMEVGDKLLLSASKIVKLIERGLEEVDASPPADRALWIQKAGESPVSLADRLLESINKLGLSGGSRFALSYKQQYIGLTLNGAASNMVTAKPRKSGFMVGQFKFPDDPDLRNSLEASGPVPMSYDKTYGRFRVRLREADFNQRRSQIEDLIKRAHAHYFDTSETEAPND